MTPLISPDRAALRSGAVFGSAAALFWGAYLVATRLSVTSGMTPADVILLRYGVAAVVMAPWLARWLWGRPPAGAVSMRWGQALILALCAGPVFMFLAAGAFRFAPLAHGAVLQPSSLTLGGMILAAALLGERFTVLRVGGALVIAAGLALIAGPGLFATGASTPLGDAMFMAAGWTWALFSVLLRIWRIGPAQATAVVSVLSALIFVPLYFMFDDAHRLLALSPGMLATQVIVQGGLAGVGAVFAFARAVQLIGVARAAIFPACVPALAILMGIPVTGDIPTLLQCAGLVVVTLGMLLAFGLLTPQRSPVAQKLSG